MSTIEFNQMLVNNTEFLKPFALTLTRDHEKARDLFQETCYKALRNKDKYSVGTNIKAWLYTIMRNIFINDYRKNSKRSLVLDGTPNDFFLDNQQMAIPDSAYTMMSTKEINLAITQLPEIFRQPFILYFEGYKYGEIAEILKEHLGTIKSRIHFARKLLKEQIERN
jgi:RNA polymerase sigma factor (sigma-70 family)